MLEVRQYVDVGSLPELVETLIEWRNNPEQKSKMQAVRIPHNQLSLMPSLKTAKDTLENLDFNQSGDRFVVVLDEDSIHRASEYLKTYGKWPDGTALQREDLHINDPSNPFDAAEGVRDSFLHAKKLGHRGIAFVFGGKENAATPLFLVKHVPNSLVTTATGQDVQSIVNQREPGGF